MVTLIAEDLRLAGEGRGTQISLDHECEDRLRLEPVLERINARYGRRLAGPAGAGLKAGWQTTAPDLTPSAADWIRSRPRRARSAAAPRERRRRQGRRMPARPAEDPGECILLGLPHESSTGR
ncbi:hypothetical protein ACFT6Z_25400 [Streptomyces sp. NPDC057131]|uniref:hypothetical protein n=1 Tax=Streptomyces sp. NPDC057131 TaxID=3346027 RepID=UPI003642115C